MTDFLSATFFSSAQASPRPCLLFSLLDGRKSELRYARVACVLLSLSALAGCQVASVKPVGVVPVSVEADDWEGLWVSDDGFNWGVIRVVNAVEGELELGVIDDDEDSFWLHTVPVFLRTAATDTAEGKAMYVSMYDEDSDLYAWGLLRKNDDHVEIRLPVASRFRQFVEEGSLPGRVKGDMLLTVILGELTDEHLAFISATDETLWEPGEYGTIVRRYVSN